MAQLYKMTLYVCDLEENLSLNEIKRLIKDDALDGISTSCVTHFANEKVGAHVDWDDNIDINYTSSTTIIQALLRINGRSILMIILIVFCVTRVMVYAQIVTDLIT